MKRNKKSILMTVIMLICMLTINVFATVSNVAVGSGTGYLNVYSISGYAETNVATCGEPTNSSYVSVSISCLQNNGYYKTDSKTNTGIPYVTAWVRVNPDNDKTFTYGSADFSFYRCSIHQGYNSTNVNV